ncbi:MAG: ATP-binding protein [Chryseolinea sp.]
MSTPGVSDKGFKIFGKLFISHSSVGLIAIIAASVIFYSILRVALINRALDQLSSINVLKKHLIEDYLYRSRLNLEALQVEEKFLNIYYDVTNYRQSRDHRDIKDIYSLCKLYDFANLHIFDTNHRQLFSTDEEMYPDSLLHKLDDAIRSDRKHIHVIDASMNSKKGTLLFYYVPIVLQDSLLGSVLVQENFDKIQQILLENTAMGTTGESYIAASDFLLRSKSRFFPDSTPGHILAETEAINNLIKGKEGRGIVKDYRSISVLSAYRSVANDDLNWFILSEMDEAEAMRPIVALRNYFMLITVVIMLLVLMVTYFISNAIIRPIVELQSAIQILSRGIIPSPKPRVHTSDEIGEMGTAIGQLIEGFERTTSFASEIGRGNFDASYVALSQDDSLGHALIKMRDELKTFHTHELKSARSRAAALLEGQESERTRIVKELHDGVGQLLTAISMQVDMVDGPLDKKADLKKYINEAVVEIKRISYNVMPQAIVDFGLEAALNGLCESVRRYSSISIDFRYVRETEHTLDFDVTIAVYRIMQEGLNNIVKHANAAHVNLHILDKVDELYCVLEDDGRGFDPSLMDGGGVGSGLRNIRERAQLMNGTAEIQSQPGHGTVIEIHIPMPEYVADH